VDNELLDGFYLGSVRVEPLTGTIVRNGESKHLPSKAAEVLLWLAKNPRRLVERDELISRVWGEGHGSADALTHAMVDIRQALGDKSDHPTFIQTVPTRGYRLLIVPAAEHSYSQVMPDRSRPFWQELVRHGVVQAVIAYSIVGWALIQVAGETFGNLGLPPWTVPFVTFMVVGGFPIVILLSWFLESSDGKMVLDMGQHEGGAWQGLSRNYVAIIAAYLVAAIGSTVYQVSVGFPVPDSNSGPVVAGPSVEDENLIPIAENSIAVLKFAALDGNESTQVFANGLSEDILDRIARVPGLLVSARGDSWSLSPQAISRDVRRRLRVAFYVEGSVRIEDSDITVVAQLIDSATGFHMSSKTVRSTLTRFGEIQEEMTRLIVADLRVSLPEHIQEYAALPPEELGIESDIDAYVQFRRGRDIMNSPYTLQTIDEAKAYFNQALSIDPRYAAAYAGICGVYTVRYQLAGSLPDIDEAEGFCNRALITAPRLALAHRAIGNFYVEVGKVADAERSFRNALELNPKDADAMLGLARALRRYSQKEEAEDLIQQAINLQPGNWRAFNALGALHFTFGEYEEAVEAYNRVEYLYFDNFVGIENMATATMMVGDFEKARQLFERAVETEPTPLTYSNLGILLYYLGDFEQSVEYHRQAVALTPNDEGAWLSLADALHFLGNEAEAAEAFQAGADIAGERNRANPGDPETLTYLAWAETMTGNEEGGMRYAELAVEVAPDDPYSYYYLGLVALQEGDTESAIEAVETAVELGYSRVMLAAEPYFEPLRGRREFAALLSD
jgi:tetratricopeptide (TPR) repeat protein/DNA-binding winged helix-turn-helix (wHTH) protein